MSAEIRKALLGRHYVYRTQFTRLREKYEVLSVGLDIREGWFGRLVCDWRLLGEGPLLTAHGRVDLFGKFVWMTMVGTEPMTRPPFVYAFELEEETIATGVTIAVAAGRFASSQAPYCGELIVSRRELTDDQVVAIIGPESTRALSGVDVRGRLSTVVGAGREGPSP